MATEDFQRGQTVTELKNIKGEIVEIKGEMKDHNKADKESFDTLGRQINEVKNATRDAADEAKGVKDKLEESETIRDEQHGENKKTLASINLTVTKLATDQASTKAAVTRIYIVAGTIGGMSGTFLPYAIQLFMKYVLKI